MTAPADAIGALIRNRIATDSELRHLAEQARQRRLSVAVGLLPRSVQPSRFTHAALEDRFGARPDGGWYAQGPQWTRGVSDPWRRALVRHTRRRLAEILTSTFDALRRQELIASGVNIDGCRTPIGVDLWSAPGLVLDLRKSSLVADTTVLFAGIQIDAPSPPARPLPEAVARQFLASLAERLPHDRQFTAGDAAGCLRTAFAGSVISDRQVARLLRDLQPAAWARCRRRASAEPTQQELAAAAEAARSTIER